MVAIRKPGEIAPQRDGVVIPSDVKNKSIFNIYQKFFFFINDCQVISNNVECVVINVFFLIPERKP